MHRRAVVATVATGLTVTAGCVGGGSDIVATVQRNVSVRPGRGWVEEIPDVSGSGGAIQYKATAPRPFEVYFFTADENYMYYDTYVDGGEPARTPDGDRDVGGTAEQVSDSGYRAATPNDGARHPIDDQGPYYFVVDHSDYGEASPNDERTPLSVFVDLTVTQRTLF